MIDADRAQPILVVDDDPFVREAITAVLLYGGYSRDNVETASNGREALSCVADCPPSLVLLDVLMPGGDGPSFLREARAQGFDAPVILVTSEPDPKRIAAECGASGYIAKPFRPCQLLAAVERFCPH